MALEEDDLCEAHRFLAETKDLPVILVEVGKASDAKPQGRYSEVSQDARMHRLRAEFADAREDAGSQARRKIVACSSAFLDFLGYARKDVLGEDLMSLLLKGIPERAISRSCRKNIEDYFEVCAGTHISHVGESFEPQAIARADGSHVVSMIGVGHCVILDKPYVLCILRPVVEGLVGRLSISAMEKEAEQTRIALKKIRGELQLRTANAAFSADSVSSFALKNTQGGRCRRVKSGIFAQPDFKFFSRRLQGHCLLQNDCSTAVRRLHEEYTSDCLVFSDRPISRCSEGLHFCVRVDSLCHRFLGLPLLGFTQQRPIDEPGLFARMPQYMARTFLIGGQGYASARDMPGHYDAGFGKVPESEVQTWRVQPEVPQHQRETAVKIAKGDVLGCTYTFDGFLKLSVNGEELWCFDLGRPLNGAAEYYAVCSVSDQAASLTVLNTGKKGNMRDTFASNSTACAEGDSFRSSSTEGDSFVHDRDLMGDVALFSQPPVAGQQASSASTAAPAAAFTSSPSDSEDSTFRLPPYALLLGVAVPFCMGWALRRSRLSG